MSRVFEWGDRIKPNHRGIQRGVMTDDQGALVNDGDVSVKFGFTDCLVEIAPHIASIKQWLPVN